MRVDDLKSVEMFADLDDAQLERWAEKFQEVDLLNGSVLIREGEFAYKFFVVLDGEVEVQRNFEHVATLGPGDFFGEMGVIEQGRRNARIVAQSRCRVAWMMGWDFEEMTAAHPAVAARIQAVVDERMRSLPDDA